MKTLTRCLALASLGSLLLGQLARVTLTAQIAIYPHDLLIMMVLILNLPALIAVIRPIIFKRKFISGMVLILWVFLALLINGQLGLIPLLYLARLGAYGAFFVIIAREKIFTDQEILMILYTFFILLTGLNLGQYWLFPDARVLEQLGWDDHYFRVIGTWLDPAFSALALDLGLIFLAANYRRLTRGRAAKITFWLVVALLGGTLLLTYSRSAYLALLAVATAWGGRHFSPVFRQKLAKNVGVVSVGVSLLVIGILVVWVFLAWRVPSDSTNLLRTNSIRIRAEMLAEQLEGWQWWQWLIGRGVFVPLSASPPPDAVPGFKQTAAFPDNFELLAVSFLGLPIALIWLYCLVQWWRGGWQTDAVESYYLLAIFVSAQFNQSFFQPFIVLTLGWLLVAAWANR